jgi:hypothetical protein
MTLVVRAVFRVVAYLGAVLSPPSSTSPWSTYSNDRRRAGRAAAES